MYAIVLRSGSSAVGDELRVINYDEMLDLRAAIITLSDNGY